MTWTYSPTDLSTDLAKVRLYIGDTDTSDQLATDEEINAVIAGTDGLYSAAALMCRSVSAKFARQIDTSVESVSRKASQRSVQYAKMAENYTTQSSQSGAGLGVPFVGGVSISEMDSVENDSDRVPPSFRRGMFSNPSDGDFDDLRSDD